MVRFIIAAQSTITDVTESIYIPIWLDLLLATLPRILVALLKFTFQYG